MHNSLRFEQEAREGPQEAAGAIEEAEVPPAATEPAGPAGGESRPLVPLPVIVVEGPPEAVAQVIKDYLDSEPEVERALGRLYTRALRAWMRAD